MAAYPRTYTLLLARPGLPHARLSLFSSMGIPSTGECACQAVCANPIEMNAESRDCMATTHEGKGSPVLEMPVPPLGVHLSDIYGIF